MEKRSHKIGSYTAGIGLIIFGILFLIAIFFPAVNYQMVIKLWPLILIGIGIEILVGNNKSKRQIDRV